MRHEFRNNFDAQRFWCKWDLIFLELYIETAWAYASFLDQTFTVPYGPVTLEEISYE